MKLTRYEQHDSCKFNAGPDYLSGTPNIRRKRGIIAYELAINSNQKDNNAIHNQFKTT